MRRFKPQIKFAIVMAFAVFHEIALSQVYPARFYSTLDGLPTNSVFDITQDPQGMMWFLTANGVASYDGQKWSQPKDSIDFPNSEYSYIREAADSSIWVAGQNNTTFLILRLKNGRWKNIDIPDELKELKYGFSFEIQAHNDGYTVWVSTKNKIFTYQSTDRQWTTVPFSFAVRNLRFQNDTLYVCSDNGLFTMLDGNTYSVPIKGSNLNNEFLNLVIKNEKKYLLGYNWLAIAEGNKVVQYWEDPDMGERSQFNKYDLVVDDRDRIFYNCNSPIKIFDPITGVSETLEVKGKIQNAKSISIYKDLENSIWVGDRRGLFRFNLLRFLNFDRSIGLLEDEVSSIIQLKNGDVVLATPSSINFLRNNKIVHQARLPLGKNQVSRVLDVIEDDSGALFLATGPAGLFKYQKNHFQKIIYPSKPDIDFTSLIQFNDRLYASSRLGGIFEIVRNELRLISDIKGVRKLNRLNEDEIAANTQRGFYKISKKDTFLVSSGLRDIDNVYSVIEWNKSLLVATNAGLYTVENNKIGSRFQGISLPSYSLIKDESKNLWVGTGDGVLRWDGSEIKKYDRSHGLIGSEVNRSALIQDFGGKVWIGTELGASVYEEAEDLTLNLKPIVTITSLLDGSGSILDPRLRNQIPFGLNTIEIYFRGISFINEDQIVYRYRLDGFDKKWFEIGNKSATSARYTNLRSGEYTLIVQARTDQGKWSDPVKSTFKINRPFYFQWWFLLSVFFFLLTLFYSIYRIRFYYLLKRQKELRELVKSRTREIMQLNESLESMVKERTKELEDKNQRLSDYAYINAHLLRGPLTRIQSLTLLRELDKDDKLNDSFLEILKTATEELDEVIFSINKTLKDKKPIGRPTDD